MGPQPRIFHFSLDWRFLVPIADVKKMRLLFEGDKDVQQTLERVGINQSQQVSLADLRQGKIYDVQTFVLPFGLPIHAVSRNDEDQVAFYSSVRRLIARGGYVLVGFNNAWNVRAGSRARYYACTPRRMAWQLKQSGFQSIKVFGAMPNLNIPEYIFDMDSQAIQFALQNRFRRKPALLGALRVLSVTIGLKRISSFLPCYFATATA
jgi:hypothetical protein